MEAGPGNLAHVVGRRNFQLEAVLQLGQAFLDQGWVVIFDFHS